MQTYQHNPRAITIGDIETTGLNPQEDRILSFALMLIDCSDRNVSEEYAIYAKLEVYIDWPDLDLPKGFLVILPGHQRIQEICRGQHPLLKPIPLSELLPCIRDFCFGHKLDPLNITVCGKNFASFDLNFLRLLPGYGTIVRFHHRVLDLGSLYYRPKVDAQVLPNLAMCAERAGLSLADAQVKHEAMADVELVQKVLLAYYCPTPIQRIRQLKRLVQSYVKH